jgi:hypothetical protein
MVVVEEEGYYENAEAGGIFRERQGGVLPPGIRPRGHRQAGYANARLGVASLVVVPLVPVARSVLHGVR